MSHITCRPHNLKHLALVVSLALTSLAGSLPATAVDPTSPTGVDQTMDRTITIWAKDSTAIGLEDGDPQYTFATDPKGEALDDATVRCMFRITKFSLTGSQTLAKVNPSDASTYTAGAMAYVATEVTTNTSKAIINFANPVSLSDGSGHVTVVNGEVSADGYNFEAQDTTNYPLDVFIDPLGSTGSTADGMYIIQEWEGPNLKPWVTVVEIPTYLSSQIDTLATPAPGTVNYTPVVYAKVKPAITPSFSSYVDILDKPDSTSAATLVVGRGTGAGADPEKWETTGITKGTTHTFTAAFVINGFKYTGSTARGVVFGFGYGELDTTVPLTVRQESVGRGTWVEAPAAVANKTLTVRDNTELGVLVRNLEDPTLTQYCAVFNQKTSEINTSSPYGNFTNKILAAPNNWTLGRLAKGAGNQINNSFGTGQIQYLVPTDAIGPTNANTGQSGIYDAVALALGATELTKGGSPIINQNRGTCLAGTSLSAINTKNYTTAEEIFGLTSNIQVEITVSIRGSVTGTAFQAGDTDLVNFKPFLYGATNGHSASASVSEDDIFAFEPTVNPPTSSSTAAYNGKHFVKLVDQNAYVYTGAVNAIKVDQNGKPLPGAKFALIQRVNGVNSYASNIGSTGGTATPETAGPNFNVTAPTAGTFANVWVKTSTADGTVSFDGVNPDADSPSGGQYAIVELVSPVGYKDLAHNTVPDVTDYGGTTISAISLSWADNLTASAKQPGETGYKALTKIINVPLLALPNTGGSGLFWLLAIGIGLLAGSLLIRRQTRQNAIS